MIHRARLAIDPASTVPIWRQIEDGVARLVAAGRLAVGAPVPSVRELARELRVNPATVAKAYRRLVDQGVLEVRRGEGTFVASASDEELRAARRELLREEAKRFVYAARQAGCSSDEAVVAVRDEWTGGDDE